VLRKITGLMTDEVTGKWRRLHNEKHYDQYSSPNIIRVFESRMRLAGHVACMGEKRGAIGFWWGNLTDRDHLEGLEVYGRIILKWIFKKSEWGMD
jgi:hypothetical protein